jgi:hypothetical protein
MIPGALRSASPPGMHSGPVIWISGHAQPGVARSAQCCLYIRPPVNSVHAGASRFGNDYGQSMRLKATDFHEEINNVNRSGGE